MPTTILSADALLELLRRYIRSKTTPVLVTGPQPSHGSIAAHGQVSLVVTATCYEVNLFLSFPSLLTVVTLLHSTFHAQAGKWLFKKQKPSPLS